MISGKKQLDNQAEEMVLKEHYVVMGRKNDGRILYQNCRSCGGSNQRL